MRIEGYRTSERDNNLVANYVEMLQSMSVLMVHINCLHNYYYSYAFSFIIMGTHTRTHVCVSYVNRR